MENVSTIDRSNCRESDQASYFYVVWPEETVTTISAAGTLDSTLCGSQVQRPVTTNGGVHRHLHTLRNQGQHMLQEDHQDIMEHSSVALSPPGGRLPEIEVGGFASPLTSPILSIADASPLVAQSSAAVQTSPQEIADRRAEQQEISSERNNAIGSDLHLVEGTTYSRVACESMNTSSTSQLSSPKTSSLIRSGQLQSNTVQASTSVESSNSSSGQGSSGSSERGNSPPSVENEPGNRRKRSRMQYYSLNGCLECEVKDAEIKTLRRRIQMMEEVMALLNQKINALQQSSNGMLFSPMVVPPVVSQVMIPTTYPTSTTSIKTQIHAAHEGHSGHSVTATPPHTSSDNEDTSSDSASIAYAQSELCPSAEHRVELIAGSGVYVTLPRLEEARREAKNGTQLARKLMDAFWDRETLARSSLSSKSKFQYQQLDPNVINAIEAYCLNFDSSTHSRDLHACMTDKCCQARSRRATPFKTATAVNNGIQQNVVQNGLRNGINTT